eukprot:2429814-Pleurochrysis_carterae.AAC.1
MREEEEISELQRMAEQRAKGARRRAGEVCAHPMLGLKCTWEVGGGVSKGPLAWLRLHRPLCHGW